MTHVLLFAAIMIAFGGNFSSSPNQSSRAHENQITQSIPKEPFLVAGIIENPQSGNPTNTSTPKTPHWYQSAEWVLVIVGVVAFSLVGWQSWETRRSANAAEKSIILTHRPKIAIRSVTIPWMQILNRSTSDKEILETVLARPDLNQQKLEGFFYAVNVGNQPAVIKTLDECLFFGETLPMERPYESGKERRVINIELQAGESCKIIFTPKQVTSMELAVVSTQEPTFYVMGRLVYADSLGNLRETGFCRTADYRTKIFAAVNNPDYEYAD